MFLAEGLPFCIAYRLAPLPAITRESEIMTKATLLDPSPRGFTVSYTPRLAMENTRLLHQRNYGSTGTEAGDR